MKCIAVRFSCSINGAQFCLDGEVRQAPRGPHETMLVFDRSVLPPGFVPELLSYVCMGCSPPAGCRGRGDDNPFADGGDFCAWRSLDMGHRGHLEAEYRCKGRGGDAERLDFRVCGTTRIDSLVMGIFPTVETWTPLQDRRFATDMAFAWRLAEGRDVHAVSRGHYVLSRGRGLPRTLLRVVAFDLEVSPRSFLQREAAGIYDSAAFWGDVATPRAMQRGWVPQA